MDEITATTLHALAVGLDRDLAAMAAVIATVPDEALRRRPDRAVADIMGAIARDLVFPIERLRPALRPPP